MKNVYLMGSDSTGNTKLNMEESAVSIGLRLNDKDETFRLFDVLLDGGCIVTSLKKVFYADCYGLFKKGTVD